MKIYADKEGKEVIVQLCDIALKTGGLQNLNGINNVLTSLQDYIPPPADNPVEPINKSGDAPAQP